MPAVPPPKPLLPPEVRAKLPSWRSTADEEDPIALVKLTLPSNLGAVWTWYVVEYDGEDTCFGLVIGDEIEAGYFSLSELESLYDALRANGTLAELIRQGETQLPVARDEQFRPQRLSALRRKHQARRALARPWAPGI
jgi:hypothetical protein